MTISRNLFFFIISSLPCALNAGGNTYITNQALPYDVISPKATIILGFAQSISSPFSYSGTHTSVAQWLTKGIAHYLFDNITIITIANIIESDATLDVKMTNLLAIQADWDIKQAKFHRENALISGLFFSLFAATMCAIIYDILKKSGTAAVTT
jgi:hypothetical protein